jgi:hypothetical protein
MSRFRVYVPSRDGPERLLLSTSSANTASDAVLDFSPVTHHNLMTIRSRRDSLITPNSQSDLTLVPIPTPQIFHIHRHAYISMEQDPKFLRTLNRYASIYHRSFPRTPCSHCAILLLNRHIVWSEKHEDFDYNLSTTLNVPLVERVVCRNGVNVNCVAICRICSQRPRSPPGAGPWPDVLLLLPQRSRKFLSPLTLQTNLGRTRSHHKHINPFSTYRTLTGESIFVQVRNPT